MHHNPLFMCFVQQGEANTKNKAWLYRKIRSQRLRDICLLLRKPPSLCDHSSSGHTEMKQSCVDGEEIKHNAEIVTLSSIVFNLRLSSWLTDTIKSKTGSCHPFSLSYFTILQPEHILSSLIIVWLLFGWLEERLKCYSFVVHKYITCCLCLCPLVTVSSLEICHFTQQEYLCLLLSVTTVQQKICSGRHRLRPGF